MATDRDPRRKWLVLVAAVACHVTSGGVALSFGVLATCICTMPKTRVSFGHNSGVLGRHFRSAARLPMSALGCGLAIGVSIVPLFIRLLLDHLSYLRAYIVCAAIVLNGIACGLLFVPPESNASGAEVGEYRRMENEHVSESSDNATPQPSYDEPLEEARGSGDENGEKAKLKRKPEHHYHSVIRPEETIIVSTLERSWKFDDNELYETASEDEADEDGDATGETPVDEESAVTRDPPVQDSPKNDEELQPEPSKTAPLTLLGVVTGLTEPREICSWRFSLFAISSFLFYLGFVIPLTFYPAVSKQKGYKDTTSVWTLPAMGAGAACGVIMCGALLAVFERRSTVNRLMDGRSTILIAALGSVLAGLSVAFLQYYKHFSVLMITAALFGFFSAFYLRARLCCIQRVCGIDLSASAWIFTGWLAGFAPFIALPITGWLADNHGDYTGGHLMAAVALGLAGVVLSPLLILTSPHRT
ncbi:hypothetical protein MAR_023773 [Mya arenaria]|uniref:Uncharacterized protein n=1 Tax=Mya arenaria TaxID=6604 RepID=A0ABY7DSS2_MYAAR|nr:hypothetical protein MAR_023773 [Mya arenaria]